MSKVHITLVGGQPAPVYHGFVATKPDKIIYIYSANSRKALKALDLEITKPSEYIMLDVTLPDKIKKCAEELAEQYKDDEVTVNISGGLKSWSHWFGVIFDKYPNAAVVYMDQNNVLWNYRTMKSSADFEFDMHTLFRLYGNPLENNYSEFESYTKEDFKAVNKIEELRRINTADFNKLTTVLDRERSHLLCNSKVGTFTAGESYVQWDKNFHQVKLGLCKKGMIKETLLDSPHIMSLVFNAGWFETKVAKLLSGWNKAKNIYMNCRFPFKPNIDKNEVDIIVNTGVKILFVECKTQINNTTDIDKFRSVIKGYGGTGSKGLFVTDAKMTEIARAKCEEHGILTFSLKDDHLGLSVEKALYLLLDTQLYNINTK